MLQRYVSKIYIDEKEKKNISNFSQMENFKRKRRFVVNIRHLSPKNYYIVDEERRNEGFFPFFPSPFFFLPYHGETRAAAWWFELITARNDLRRFTSLGLRSQKTAQHPKSGRILERVEGFVHPRTNFAFIRLPSIITWQAKFETCNDKGKAQGMLKLF